MEEIKLCEYGCGQEAKFYFKTSDKWCCNSHFMKCPEQIKIISLKYKGTHKLIKFENLNHIICDFGCGQEAKFISKYGKFCCSESRNSCPALRNHNSIVKKGKIYTEAERLEKYKTRIGGKKPGSSIYMKNGGSAHCNSFPRDPVKIKKIKESQRQKCLDGHAITMLKAQTNPSKPEVMLREMVKEIYPDCEFQYGVFNYALDVAIPDYKIAIEYDGWFHFDTEEHKEYHKMRQTRIEKEGWKFIRYNIFQKFPTYDQVKKDINKNLQGNG